MSISIEYEGNKQEITLEALATGGGAGGTGATGADGISCTHEWDGTTLTVTSASGTSSADLQGPQGDPGVDGTVSFEELTEEQVASLKGDSGVYVGTDEPTDLAINVWVNPGGEALTAVPVTVRFEDGTTETFTLYTGVVSE